MGTEVLQKNAAEFYSNAVHYWSEVPATLDGMLGGYGFISQTDIRGSKVFLKQLFSSKQPPGRQYALDCGAGIGRITKFLLTDLFDKVDLVEQNPLFLEQAKRYLGKKLESKIGEFYPTGLQNFIPDKNKYDVIWIQWVLGHLTDDDLVQFLNKCQQGLKDGGMIIIKENITSSDLQDVDSQDSSVTRPMAQFRRLFSLANLECYRQVKQTHFPKGIYTVYMFALKPITTPTEVTCDNKERNQEIESTSNSHIESDHCDNKEVDTQSEICDANDIENYCDKSV